MNQINIPMIGSAINLVMCVISFWKSLTLNRDNDDDDDLMMMAVVIIIMKSDDNYDDDNDE